jgi:hypothetical protein
MDKATVLKVYNQIDPKDRTRDQTLISEARTLTRLQAKQRKQRRELKETTRQIKITRVNLKRLMSITPAWNEQAPPSRLFGERDK